MAQQSSDHGLWKFLSKYTSGVDVRDVHRVLGKDATRAYDILTREHTTGQEPAKDVEKWWYRARMLFLGMSTKLTPARRILFIVCLVSAVLGLVNVSFEVDETRFAVLGFSPLLMAAVVGLVFLLILELADRVLVRDELEVARQLQRDLLPSLPPAIGGYTFCFSYRTANTIGGDYYDFIPLPDGRLALVVGDASGHGIAAGLLMAIANATLQLAIDLDPDPAAVADLMNRALYRTSGSRAFMTIFYAVLDPHSGMLDYVSIGHPYPLLRRVSGEIEELGSGCLPLGVRESITPKPQTTELRDGDLLVMYTDGIPETLNEAGEAFGFERVREVVADGGPPVSVHDRMITTLERFAGGAPLLDDCSLVAIGRVG